MAIHHDDNDHDRGLAFDLDTIAERTRSHEQPGINARISELRSACT